jgi:hypothetical protein
MKKTNKAVTFPLLDIIEAAESICKTARRHRHGLSGGGFYATKFGEAHAEAINSLRELQIKAQNLEDNKVKQTLTDISNHLQTFFDPSTDNRERSRIKQNIVLLLKTAVLPLFHQMQSHAPSDNYFPLEIVKSTRPYIEKVARQACGCYDFGWYDGAAVMARRLLETLIIELFEEKKLDNKIKKTDGSFHFLSGLISVLLAETSFNIGRNTKKALPLLKDLGDQSAHSRRYTARQQDLDSVKRELRITIEELVHLIGYK